MSEDMKNPVPAAGCTACGGHAWALILDEFPPKHTKITHLVCVACGGGMPVNIEVDKMRDKSQWKEVVDKPEEDVST